MPRFRNAPVDAVLDVRTKVEFWLGHLPGAVNLPVDRLPDAMADHPEIARDARILVYCASGGRSAMAAQLLRGAGYAHVVDGGGMASAKAEFSA